MGLISLFFSLLAVATFAVAFVDRIYIARVLAHYKVTNELIYLYNFQCESLLILIFQLNHYHEESLKSPGSVFNTVHQVLDEFKEKDDHFPPEEDSEVKPRK